MPQLSLPMRSAFGLRPQPSWRRRLGGWWVGGLLCGLSLVSTSIEAAPCISAQGGDFANPGTWQSQSASCGSDLSLDYEIAPGTQVSWSPQGAVLSGKLSIGGDLQIQGGTLTLENPEVEVTGSGSWSVQDLSLHVAGFQQSGGTSSLDNVSLQVAGIWNQSAGTLTANSTSLSLTGRTEWYTTASLTLTELQLSGNLLILGNSSTSLEVQQPLLFNTPGSRLLVGSGSLQLPGGLSLNEGALEGSGGNITLGMASTVGTSGRLDLRQSQLILQEPLEVSGALRLDSGSTFSGASSLQTAQAQVEVQGAVTLDALILDNASGMKLLADSQITNSYPLQLASLDLNGYTFTLGNETADLLLSGDLEINLDAGRAFDTGLADLEVTGALNLISGTLRSSGGGLTVAGEFLSAGTLDLQNTAVSLQGGGSASGAILLQDSAWTGSPDPTFDLTQAHLKIAGEVSLNHTDFGPEALLELNADAHLVSPEALHFGFALLNGHQLTLDSQNDELRIGTLGEPDNATTADADLELGFAPVIVSLYSERVSDSVLKWTAYVRDDNAFGTLLTQWEYLGGVERLLTSPVYTEIPDPLTAGSYGKVEVEITNYDDSDSGTLRVLLCDQGNAHQGICTDPTRQAQLDYPLTPYAFTLPVLCDGDECEGGTNPTPKLSWSSFEGGESPDNTSVPQALSGGKVQAQGSDLIFAGPLTLDGFQIALGGGTLRLQQGARVLGNSSLMLENGTLSLEGGQVEFDNSTVLDGTLEVAGSSSLMVGSGVSVQYQGGPIGLGLTEFELAGDGEFAFTDIQSAFVLNEPSSLLELSGSGRVGRVFINADPEPGKGLVISGEPTLGELGFQIDTTLSVQTQFNVEQGIRIKDVTLTLQDSGTFNSGIILDNGTLVITDQPTLAGEMSLLNSSQVVLDNGSTLNLSQDLILGESRLTIDGEGDLQFTDNQSGVLLSTAQSLLELKGTGRIERVYIQADPDTGRGLQILGQPRLGELGFQIDTTLSVQSQFSVEQGIRIKDVALTLQDSGVFESGIVLDNGTLIITDQPTLAGEISLFNSSIIQLETGSEMILSSEFLLGPHELIIQGGGDLSFVDDQAGISVNSPDSILELSGSGRIGRVFLQSNPNAGKGMLITGEPTLGELGFQVDTTLSVLNQFNVEQAIRIKDVTLTLQDSGTFNSGIQLDNGTLVVTDQPTLSGALSQTSSSSIQFANDATLTTSQGINLNDGTLRVSGQGSLINGLSLSLTSGNIALELADNITYSGAIELGAGTLKISGPASLGGDLSVGDNATLVLDASLSYSGNAVSLGAYSLHIQGDGEWSFTQEGAGVVLNDTTSQLQLTGDLRLDRVSLQALPASEASSVVVLGGKPQLDVLELSFDASLQGSLSVGQLLLNNSSLSLRQDETTLTLLEQLTLEEDGDGLETRSANLELLGGLEMSRGTLSSTGGSLKLAPGQTHRFADAARVFLSNTKLLSTTSVRAELTLQGEPNLSMEGGSITTIQLLREPDTTGTVSTRDLEACSDCKGFNDVGSHGINTHGLYRQVSSANWKLSEAEGPRKNASLKVKLLSRPTADVTVVLRSSDLTEAILDQYSLSFNADNWNQTQTVLISGVDDFSADGDVRVTINGYTLSTDSKYGGSGNREYHQFKYYFTNLNDDLQSASVPKAVIAQDLQQINEGSRVFLDGSGSNDPDPTLRIVKYQWELLGEDDRIQLVDSNRSIAYLDTPDNLSEDLQLTFSLTVTNSAGATATATCDIEIQDTISFVNPAGIALFVPKGLSPPDNNSDGSLSLNVKSTDGAENKIELSPSGTAASTIKGADGTDTRVAAPQNASFNVNQDASTSVKLSGTGGSQLNASLSANGVKLNLEKSGKGVSLAAPAGTSMSISEDGTSTLQSQLKVSNGPSPAVKTVLGSDGSFEISLAALGQLSQRNPERVVGGTTVRAEPGISTSIEFAEGLQVQSSDNDSSLSLHISDQDYTQATLLTDNRTFSLKTYHPSNSLFVTESELDITSASNQVGRSIQGEVAKSGLILRVRDSVDSNLISSEGTAIEYSTSGIVRANIQNDNRTGEITFPVQGDITLKLTDIQSNQQVYFPPMAKGSSIDYSVDQVVLDVPLSYVAPSQSSSRTSRTSNKVYSLYSGDGYWVGIDPANGKPLYINPVSGDAEIRITSHFGYEATIEILSGSIETSNGLVLSRTNKLQPGDNFSVDLTPASIEIDQSRELVSLPAYTSIAAEVFSDNFGNFKAVWTYQEGSWKFYTSDATLEVNYLSSGYEKLTTPLESGDGFWVEQTSGSNPTSISFLNTGPYVSLPLLNETNEEWTLVGASSEILVQDIVKSAGFHQQQEDDSNAFGILVGWDDDLQGPLLTLLLILGLLYSRQRALAIVVGSLTIYACADPGSDSSLQQVPYDPSSNRVHSVWKWDASASQWLAYAPDTQIAIELQGLGYASFESVHSSEAYWVRISQDNAAGSMFFQEPPKPPGF
jgi:hypothetical protein